MIYKEIISYYNQETAKGIAVDRIIQALVAAGWQKTDIDQSISSVSSTNTIASQPVVATVNPLTPANQGTFTTITELTYPVESVWIYKSTIGYFLGLLIFVILLIGGDRSPETIFYVIASLVFMVFTFILFSLRRKNFHFALETNFLFLKQGVINKQQRSIPYGVIQNVFVKRDIFDRIFGLASVLVENASQAGGQNNTSKFFGLKLQSNRKEMETVGFKGNKVSIPGLLYKNAETLKGCILQKIKDNPLKETHSGL